MSSMDMALNVARRKLAVGEEWRPCAWTWMPGNDMLMEGAVVPDIASGPRKGQPNWRKTTKGKRQKVVVTEAETAAETRRWEKETGKCAECMGTKEVFASWARGVGTKMKPCKACKGTGLAISTVICQKPFVVEVTMCNPLKGETDV